MIMIEQKGICKSISPVCYCCRTFGGLDKPPNLAFQCNDLFLMLFAHPFDILHLAGYCFLFGKQYVYLPFHCIEILEDAVTSRLSIDKFTLLKSKCSILVVFS